MISLENILIADDSLLARQMLKASIKGCLPDVLINEAKDGKDAVVQMIETPAQVVFMDYNMPEMNGTDAIDKILENFPHTIFALVTANTQQAIIDRVKDKDVTVIHKPITKEKVQGFLDQVVSRDG